MTKYAAVKPGEGSNLAMFVTQSGELKQHYQDLYKIFEVEQNGRCRLYERNSRVMTSFSMPDVSMYTGEEIIMIEYTPQTASTAGSRAHKSRSRSRSRSRSSSSSSTWSQHTPVENVTWSQARQEADYDQVRVLVHYLRLHGFAGVLVVVGPSLEGAPVLKTVRLQKQSQRGQDGGVDRRAEEAAAEAGEAAIAYVAPYVRSRDAVWADAYVTLPLTSAKVQFMLALKEQRMVEVVVSVE
jgi:hypothetical protein